MNPIVGVSIHLYTHYQGFPDEGAMIINSPIYIDFFNPGTYGEEMNRNQGRIYIYKYVPSK